jgi:hypothetical protein
VNTGAPLHERSGYSMSDVSRASERSLVVLMESRMRWKSHVRLGGRRRGDHRPGGRHRRLAADPARRAHRSVITDSSLSSIASVSRSTIETLAPTRKRRRAPVRCGRALLGHNGRRKLFCTLDGRTLKQSYVRRLLRRLADKAGR